MVFYWILALLILWSLIEQKLFVTTQYRLSAGKLGKESKELNVVVLADLHNRTFGKANQRLAQKIEALKPDLILVAGDLITKRKYCIPGNAYALLERLARSFPIYYAYGNHELNMELLITAEVESKEEEGKRKALYDSWLDFKAKLTDLGVRFLDNESVSINIKQCKLRITGINIDREYYSKKEFNPMTKEYLERILGNSSEEEYQLLIAHNPLYYEAYIEWGADLILSGHLHGGLVRIPHFGGIISPQYKFFPKYDSGCFTDKKQHMIVSRGLGTHSFMLRLFNRPELVTIRLHTKE